MFTVCAFRTVKSRLVLPSHVLGVRVTFRMATPFALLEVCSRLEACSRLVVWSRLEELSQFRIDFQESLKFAPFDEFPLPVEQQERKGLAAFQQATELYAAQPIVLDCLLRIEQVLFL